MHLFFKVHKNLLQTKHQELVGSVSILFCKRFGMIAINLEIMCIERRGIEELLQLRVSEIYSFGGFFKNNFDTH